MVAPTTITWSRFRPQNHDHLVAQPGSRSDSFPIVGDQQRAQVTRPHLPNDRHRFAIGLRPCGPAPIGAPPPPAQFGLEGLPARSVASVGGNSPAAGRATPATPQLPYTLTRLIGRYGRNPTKFRPTPPYPHKGPKVPVPDNCSTYVEYQRHRPHHRRVTSDRRARCSPASR